MVLLLADRNRLRGVADLNPQRAAGCGDTEVLIAEPADEIERFVWRLLLCEPQRVRGDLRLDCGTHVSSGAEEAISGHEPVDALVRSLKVVVLDVERDATLAVGEVGEHRLAQELAPEALPEPLDLAERLRMLRSALDVRDAMTTEEMLEVRRASPRRVLTPLVREHLAWLAILGDSTLDGLEDERRLLVMRDRPRHQIPRVVVEKRRNVHALIPPKLEREDVALPELIRLGTLESPLRFLARCVRLLLLDEALLVQNTEHRRVRDAQSLKPSKYVAEPTSAPVGIGLSQRDNSLALGTAFRRLPTTAFRFLGCAVGLALGRSDSAEPRVQGLQSATSKQPHELLHDRGRHAEHDGRVRVRRAPHHRLDDALANFERYRTMTLGGVNLRRLSLLLLRHCQSPRLPRSRGQGRQLLCERHPSKRARCW